MSRRINLSAEDCQRFASIVRSIGLAQNSLATSAGVKQPWLSYLLRGTRRTSVDAAMVERVAAQLAKILAQYIDEKRFTSDLTDERAQLDLSFLGRFREGSPTPRATNIHPPGGPIASGAVPYVGREHDAIILETLRLPSFFMRVSGPVQSGKSTALALLERRAHEIGIETAWFDPQPPSAATSNDRRDADADAESTLAASELLQARWGLEPPRRGPITTIAKLVAWLQQELAPTASRPRLLILDDLVMLGGDAAENWLSLFVRALFNYRATRGLNISVAVGMTYNFGASFARKLMFVSSVVHWQPRLEVGWLSLEQVNALLDTLRDKQATDMYHESASRELFTLFKGQPYLTHAAASDKEFRNVVQQWATNGSSASADAVRQTQWYRRHLNAIRLSLFGPTYEPDGEAHRLIKSFAEACAASVSPTIRPDIDPHHGLFLTTAKLLDELGRPALGIYRLVAEDIQRIVS